MSDDSSIQRIARLTPLSAVLMLIESRIEPVRPQSWRRLIHAYGRTLAEDAVAFERPAWPIALRDGFAVEAAAVGDASSYAPVALPASSGRIGIGEPMPAATDAVLPLDAVVLRGDRAEAIAAIAPGEGVLAAGGDAPANTPLRRAGERIRAVDIAVMHAAGLAGVSVREPRISVAIGGTVGSALDAAGATLIGLVNIGLVNNAGGTVPHGLISLEAVLAGSQTDAIVAVGGTGSGASDRAINMLVRQGRLDVHGIAVSPGETAAFGFAGARPVLLIPGRLDAAFAVWLLLGRHLLARLAGGRVVDAAATLPLKRKVPSTIGLTELIPVSAAGGFAEPLASGYLSLTALAHSDGWTVVPAESEGFAAGMPVAVTPWP
jgi:molybdopterin molybdotransferase